MGCVPTIHACEGCGDSGAAVQLIDDKGAVRPGFYCWDCATERSTPIPENAWGLRAVLVLLDPVWVRSRAGAEWLAGRLAARLDRDGVE